MSALQETIKKPHFVQHPAAEKHFPRKLINHKARQKEFTKSPEEREQLNRAKKNKNTVSCLSLIADYIRSGEPIIICGVIGTIKKNNSYQRV